MMRQLFKGINLNYKHTAIIAVCLFSFFGCSVSNQVKKYNIDKLNLIYKTDVADENGLLKTETDTSFIYYFSNNILFKTPYKYSLENDVKILKSEKRYSYFLYTKGGQYGLFFDSLYGVIQREGKVDSFLNKRAFGEADFYALTTEMKLLQSYKDEGDGYKKNVYGVIKNNDDESYPDTLLLNFAETLKSIDYSFSKKLDSIYNAKLFKVELVFSKKMSVVYKMEIPRRVYSFEFNKLAFKDEKEIIEIFEKNVEKLKIK